MKNSIPVCRSVLTHWIYDDAEYFKVWFTMLARANYSIEPKQGIFEGLTYSLPRGSFLYGRRKWAATTGVSEQRLRTLIKLLEKDGMIINQQTTHKYTIYLIVNYDKFNPTKVQEVIDSEPDEQPTNNPQTTHKQPTERIDPNPQTTTNKEYTKKVKKEKNIYGSFKNVFLTGEEYERLKKEFSNTDDAIEFFSKWIKEKGGTKSKDHNLAIRRWVFDAVNKQQLKKPSEKDDGIPWAMSEQ